MKTESTEQLLLNHYGLWCMFSHDDRSGSKKNRFNLRNEAKFIVNNLWKYLIKLKGKQIIVDSLKVSTEKRKD